MEYLQWLMEIYMKENFKKNYFNGRGVYYFHDGIKYKGKYKQPREGTSFVVVEYSTNVSAENGYVDLRFCGVDGERLKLRGISYTTRSYDLYNSEELGTQYDVPTFTHRYAYYEVPTGCKEYMLVFGLHCDSLPDSPTANYLIKLD